MIKNLTRNENGITDKDLKFSFLKQGSSNSEIVTIKLVKKTTLKYYLALYFLFFFFNFRNMNNNSKRDWKMDRDDIYIDTLYMYADGFHFMFIHTVNMQCFITYEVKKICISFIQETKNLWRNMSTCKSVQSYISTAYSSSIYICMVGFC